MRGMLNRKKVFPEKLFLFYLFRFRQNACNAYYSIIVKAKPFFF